MYVPYLTARGMAINESRATQVSSLTGRLMGPGANPGLPRYCPGRTLDNLPPMAPIIELDNNAI
jgi:hypothetical protein